MLIPKSLISLPHFQGRGSPDWNPLAKGLFINATLGTTRGDFARSILEGIALEISENLDVMSQDLGGIVSITAAGGLTQSALFNQIQANVCNRQISLLANSEASSLGAWVSAAVALGMHPSYRAALNQAEADTERTCINPVASHAKQYEKLKVYRKKLYDCLDQNGIFRMFNEA